MAELHAKPHKTFMIISNTDADNFEYIMYTHRPL